jgi:hypothetical protein
VTAGSAQTPLVLRLPVLAPAVSIVLAAGLGLCGVLRSVADLFPGALPAHPYFVPQYAGLLYVALPLATVAVLAMLLLPGFLLALALGGARRLGALAATTFGGAYLLRAIVHSALKLGGVQPLGFGAFALAEIGLDAVLLGAVAWRLKLWRPVALPDEAIDRRRLFWLIAIPVVAVVLLLPVLFWQDMTEDGLEALEIGRSLATHIVPRFPTSPSGLMGLGIGMLSMALPVGWFVALIGPVEAAARLPLLLYLPLLFAVLAEVIEFRSPRRLTAGGEGAILLALATFVVTMVYSASYTPYSADASAPAAFESLTVLCIAATILFLWNGRTGWMLVFAVLGYLARPTGLLVLILLAVGTTMLPPDERRDQRLRLVAAVAACLATLVLYEHVFMPWAAHGLPSGYISGSILDRLRYLALTDVRRVLYLAVPCGVLPALALAAWRRQDGLARQLTVFCALYFLFFYPQAFIALHHFVPVMLLPIVVYWRVALSAQTRWPVGAAAVAAAASLLLSLPRSFAVDRSVREVGRATEIRVGDLDGGWQAYREALRARRGVRSLFRAEWEVADAARELVAAPLGVLYYAAQARRTGSDTINYVIQAAKEPGPSGFTAVASDSVLAVFVRDTTRWARDRATPPRTDYRAALYDMPRTTLHRFLGIPAHAYQLDLAQLPGMWRFFR